jgi:hypothetical protein
MCGLLKGTNSMCCSRADEAAANWREGARFAEEGNEDACFNRCPKNSRCNAKTKSCVCDIGYVMQGIECISIKEGQDEELPLPGQGWWHSSPPYLQSKHQLMTASVVHVTN